MKVEPHSASQLILDDVHVNSKDIPFAKSQERFIDGIIWKFSNNMKFSKGEKVNEIFLFAPKF